MTLRIFNSNTIFSESESEFSGVLGECLTTFEKSGKFPCKLPKRELTLLMIQLTISIYFLVQDFTQKSKQHYSFLSSPHLSPASPEPSSNFEPIRCHTKVPTLSIVKSFHAVAVAARDARNDDDGRWSRRFVYLQISATTCFEFIFPGKSEFLCALQLPLRQPSSSLFLGVKKHCVQSDRGARRERTQNTQHKTGEKIKTLL